jgi:hypothetical protein
MRQSLQGSQDVGKDLLVSLISCSVAILTTVQLYYMSPLQAPENSIAGRFVSLFRLKIIFAWTYSSWQGVSNHIFVGSFWLFRSEFLLLHFRRLQNWTESHTHQKLSEPSLRHSMLTFRLWVGSKSARTNPLVLRNQTMFKILWNICGQRGNAKTSKILLSSFLW